jgi:hypothetical protein
MADLLSEPVWLIGIANTEERDWRAKKIRMKSVRLHRSKDLALLHPAAVQ